MTCYKVAPGVRANTFVFPTDQGWLYSVAFINNPAFFKGYKVLENDSLAFEIVFDRVPLVDSTNMGDPSVRATIQVILESQFKRGGMRAIYFFWCEMHDRQEAARARLFNRWYQLSNSSGWELINFELTDLDDGEHTYFAGLFVHRDHPNYLEIEDAFAQFLRKDISTGKWVSWY